MIGNAGLCGDKNGDGFNRKQSQRRPRLEVVCRLETLVHLDESKVRCVRDPCALSVCDPCALGWSLEVRCVRDLKVELAGGMPSLSSLWVGFTPNFDGVEVTEISELVQLPD
ncbi:hypothetical protein Nepgr_016443 [Nepenthes gracilis]|uniref:Uncharacterized protein n=1 Tax=Nepenthes gracilis TaxID=150966 RepID=A0AAD3SP72_NEPGR|nr:hypothetical protein Nepgr_016443 [Nepenthes gracilis]